MAIMEIFLKLPKVELVKVGADNCPQALMENFSEKWWPKEIKKPRDLESINTLVRRIE